MSQRLRPAGDDGATLVIVLAFLAVFGVVVSVMLSQTDTSIKRTLVTREYDEKVYAADAGIDTGIQALRNADTLCAGVSGTPTQLPPMTVNGKAVQVTCQTVSGASNGAAGFAVITTDPTESSLTTQGGGTKRIGGSVFASGLANSVPNLIIQRGSLLENSATCSAGSTTAPSGIQWEAFTPVPPAAPDSAPTTNTPSPPWTYTCTSSAWTALDPNPALPSAPPAAHGPLPDRTIGNCAIFRPGTYASGMTLNKRNYLASGVYYFPSGGLTVDKQEVVAGAPAAGESAITTTVTACASDTDLLPSGTGLETIQGTGAQLIFGGNARLRVDGQADLEIYTRTGGPVNEGTSSVSIRSVPSGNPSGFASSTVPLGTATMSTASGSTHSLVAHGLVYLPGRYIDFFATNEVQAQLVGGVVAGRLQLQASASAAGLAVSTTAGVGKRQVRLVSVATDSDSRPITSVALLDVIGNSTRDARLLSWTTQPNT